MENKYLLYIDILGFSDLVKTNPNKVDTLYQTIDALNVHRHNVFKTIVFSDTILVYNKVNPISQEDHKYIVMYSCEFAQDLMYRLIPQDIYFRAILIYEQFTHYNLKNVEVFYGKALIDAYLCEKDIIGIGLYIHSGCGQYNEIFPTTKYNNELSFVHLNQSLQRLNFYSMGILPVDPILLESTDECCRIVFDVKLLEKVYNNMISHPQPKVRAKYLAVWQCYRLRYPGIIDVLEKNQFKLEAICDKYNWSTAVQRYTDSIAEIPLEE